MRISLTEVTAFIGALTALLVALGGIVRGVVRAIVKPLEAHLQAVQAELVDVKSQRDQAIADGHTNAVSNAKALGIIGRQQARTRRYSSK